jgi:hypothetical protein
MIVRDIDAPDAKGQRALKHIYQTRACGSKSKKLLNAGVRYGRFAPQAVIGCRF